MAINIDFSDFSEDLYRFAIDQMTWRGILILETSQQLSEAPNAHKLRKDLLKEDKYGLWDWWLRFGTGVENLVKAVFLRHQISLLSKRNLTPKAPGGSEAPATAEAAEVYRIVAATRVAAPKNPWLAQEFQRLGIQHPLEINAGTLGKYRNNLDRLVNISKLTVTERGLLSDALMVLADVRRNVDAHVFLKIQVGGGMQNDLTGLYLPAVNVLIDVYHR
jgi:hypothetical protein